MTNEEIKTEIDRLNAQFINTNFTLHPDNQKIVSQIVELQNQCSHLNNSNNFAISDGRCAYCGRKLVYE